jgi:uncharacterized membrane protein
MQGSHSVFAVGIAVVVSASLAFGFQKPPKLSTSKAGKAAKVGFSTVEPIIKKNCVMCHMGAKPKHALNLTTYENVMKGDKEGKVVIAGKPGDSRISKAVHRKGAAAMPPMGPLLKGDVAKIDAWIAAGAKK